MLRNTYYAIAWIYTIGLHLTIILASQVKDEQWIKDSCSKPLGLQDGRIKDSQITASSSHSVQVTGPHNARLNSSSGAGGWCHSDYVSMDSYEWIQVDFKVIKVISALRTQGRINHTEIPEYYRLEYEKDGAWVRYKLYNETQILRGNQRMHTSFLRNLHPPIIARKIRLIPVHLTLQVVVCLRFEYYGCNMIDDTLTYRSPVGDLLRDVTYDGVTSMTSTPNTLAGGLGVLADFQTGEQPLTSSISDNKGRGWVSWSAKTSRLKRDHVDVLLCNHYVRVVDKVALNMAAVPSLGVAVFSKLEVTYSMKDDFEGKSADDIYIYKDELISSTGTKKWIYVDSRQALAKFVRLRMFFDLNHLMISEIQLQTSDFNGNQSDIDAYVRDEQRRKNPPKVYNVKTSRINDTYMGILIGLTGGVLMLVLTSVAFVCLRRRGSSRCRSFSKRGGQSSRSTSGCSSGSPGSQGSSRGHRKPYPMGNGHVNYNLDEISPNITQTKIVSSNGNTYNSVSLNDSDNKEEVLSSNASNSSEPYSTLIVNLPPLPSERTTSAPKSPLASELVGIQACTGNSLYAGEHRLPVPGNEPIYEFPRENLHVEGVMGKGQYGNILYCQADHLHDFYTLDDVECCLVSVKSLNRDAGVELRSQFYNEIKICSKLCHENITRMLAVCSGSATCNESLLAISEHTALGDLNQFLAGKQISQRANSNTAVTYSTLMYMAYQISSAMEYLSSCDIIHRDLAARNCLVTNQLKVKVSDTGMSRDEYQHHYCSIDSVRLPIRWMSWESIMHGEYSAASDVWAYGVTLWQLLSMCHSQPFSELSDRQVMDSAGHRYHGRCELASCLARPTTGQLVSRELYDLMRSCWHDDPVSRPKFADICRFLQQRHEGFQVEA